MAKTLKEKYSRRKCLNSPKNITKAQKKAFNKYCISDLSDFDSSDYSYLSDSDSSDYDFDLIVSQEIQQVPKKLQNEKYDAYGNTTKLLSEYAQEKIYQEITSYLTNEQLKSLAVIEADKEQKEISELKEKAK